MVLWCAIIGWWDEMKIRSIKTLKRNPHKLNKNKIKLFIYLLIFNLQIKPKTSYSCMHGGWGLQLLQRDHQSSPSYFSYAWGPSVAFLNLLIGMQLSLDPINLFVSILFFLLHLLAIKSNFLIPGCPIFASSLRISSMLSKQTIGIGVFD